jgi:hypothetical protein
MSSVKRADSARVCHLLVVRTHGRGIIEALLCTAVHLPAHQLQSLQYSAVYLACPDTHEHQDWVSNKNVRER